MSRHGYILPQTRDQASLGHTCAAAVVSIVVLGAALVASALFAVPP